MVKREVLHREEKNIVHINGHRADVTLKYTLGHSVRVDAREQKVMVAAVLNELVHRKKLIIHGYLINVSEIYLVPGCHKRDIHAVQKWVTDALTRVLDDQVTDEIILVDEELIKPFPPMLTCSVIDDPVVYKLLTGGKLKMPFSDYYYVRLQKQIQSEEFSSAIDYRGGISPVIVTCKNR
jgi:hypothetical protein